MYSFLVLGLIPGTNLQITFRSWLVLAGWAVGATIAYRYRAQFMPEVMAYEGHVLSASQPQRRGLLTLRRVVALPVGIAARQSWFLTTIPVAERNIEPLDSRRRQ